MRNSRNRKKRQAIWVLIILGMCAAVCAVVLILRGTGFFKQNSSQIKMVENVTAPSATESVDDTEKAATAGEEPEEEQKPDELPQEAVSLSILEDRSSFAVDPANVPGNYDGTDEKVVYLTFDDGPSEYTSQVLDILDQYKAKATFFVTGLHPEYSYMIKEEYDRGHTIGLHTFSHNYAQVYSSEDAFFADLDKIGQLVAQQIGYVPCFIRFPGGSSNTVSAKYTKGIMTRLSKSVQAAGYQYYDWNCSFGDGSTRSADEIISCATDCERDNILILGHDASGKQTSVEALPTILQFYTDRGYVFKAIDRNSFIAHHGVNN